MSLQQLPIDENEASIMLKDGGLDSATWKIVQPYYERPLCVPSGELNELVDVVPEIGYAVPDSPRRLAVYEPWTEKDIERFFSDYPALVNLKPILSFETSKERRTVWAEAVIRKNGENDPLQQADFFLSPCLAMSIRGKVDVADSWARWQKRSVAMIAPVAGTFTIGNFNLNADHGLFYGYFPNTKQDSIGSDDWRFAASPTWNGILLEGSAGARIHESVFIHCRPSETAYGIKTVAEVSDRISVTSAVSRLRVSETVALKSTDLCYAEAGVAFKSKHWNSGAVVGAAPGRALATPVFAYIGKSELRATLDASYAWLPAAIPAPCSALRREILKKIHEPDSAAVDAQRVRLVCGLPMGPVQSSCGVAYYYAPGAAAAESFAEACGKTWLDFTLHYAYDPCLSGLGGDRHSISATLERQVSTIVRCGLNGRGSWNSGCFKSAFLRSTLCFNPGRPLETAPFLSLYSGSGGSCATSLGIMQTLRLFEKTFGEIKVELPLRGQNLNERVLDAKADFYW
jgi:hypothetical protein